MLHKDFWALTQRCHTLISTLGGKEESSRSATRRGGEKWLKTYEYYKAPRRLAMAVSEEFHEIFK